MFTTRIVGGVAVAHAASVIVQNATFVGGVTPLLGRCFNRARIHRITADCDTRNDRSVALLERVGMRREAHHRKSVGWKGEWTDEYVYAVLAEEWRGEKCGGH